MLLAALMAMAMEAPAAGAAAGSASPGTLESFKTLCAASEAKSEAAIRSAEQLGWSAPSADMMSRMPPGLKAGMKDIQARMSTHGNTVLVMITGNDADLGNSGHPPPNHACLVVGLNVGAVDATLKADVRAWMGAEPSLSQPEGAIYAYTQANGARTFFKPSQDQAAEQAFNSGKLTLVVHYTDGATSLIAYIVPTQAN